MTRDDIFKNAIALIKTGKKAEAQKLLEPYIEANLQDVNAWLLEAESWSTYEKKVRVLEMCLAHNPVDQQASQALATLNAQKAAANRAYTDKNLKRVIGFLLSAVGRAVLVVATIQVAISFAFLAIYASDSGASIIDSLLSIDSVLSAIVVPIVSFPISWFVFPLGLLHLPGPITGHIEIPKASNFAISGSLIVWAVWLIYPTIFTLIVLSYKRVAFFIFYTILVIILITNVAGCSTMPIPTPSF